MEFKKKTLHEDKKKKDIFESLYKSLKKMSLIISLVNLFIISLFCHMIHLMSDRMKIDWQEIVWKQRKQIKGKPSLRSGKIF